MRNRFDNIDHGTVMICISILQCRDWGVRRFMVFREQEYNLARSQPGFILARSCISHLLVYGNVESAVRLALENEFIHYLPAIIQDGECRAITAQRPLLTQVISIIRMPPRCNPPIGNFRAFVVVNHTGVCSRLTRKLYMQMWFNMKNVNIFKENY